MGFSGFILMAARSAWTEIENDIDYYYHSGKFSESLDSNTTMSCSQTGSNCHSKLIAYGAGLLIGGAVVGYLIGAKVAAKKARCNAKIKLGTDKVVDSQDIEDVGEKKAYCRCWKSNKFPLCDGSHNAHNKETGDNVGPLIISNSTKVPQVL